MTTRLRFVLSDMAMAMAVAVTAAGAASAQGRDPMQPPAVARISTAAAPAAEAAQLLVARHLLVVGGRYYVVNQGRRLGVGDMLGNARIERIDDNAVLVRRNGQSERLPLFAGVVKRASAETPATAASTASTASTGPTPARPPTGSTPR